ncbi:hypothetical protein BH10PLA2_BH10PLA2_00770 [soil metagenome]
MYKYFNNGLSFEPIQDDYVAQNGEVLFPDYATADELRASFPQYPITEADYLSWQERNG